MPECGLLSAKSSFWTKSELEDWQKMSSHRIKDAIQTRKDEGDVSAESEAANQNVDEADRHLLRHAAP